MLLNRIHDFMVGHVEFVNKLFSESFIKRLTFRIVPDMIGVSMYLISKPMINRH